MPNGMLVTAAVEPIHVAVERRSTRLAVGSMAEIKTSARTKNWLFGQDSRGKKEEKKCFLYIMSKTICLCCKNNRNSYV
jgi:hypothetical protein